MERVTSARIVKNGRRENPYYEILYRQAEDGQLCRGYGSYDLNLVAEWLSKCFQVVKEVNV